MGIDFAHFGLELGMVFEDTMGMYEHICLFNLFQMNRKERVTCEFKMDLKKSCLILPIPGLKKGMDLRGWD